MSQWLISLDVITGYMITVSKSNERNLFGDQLLIDFIDGHQVFKWTLITLQGQWGYQHWPPVWDSFAIAAVLWKLPWRKWANKSHKSTKNDKKNKNYIHNEWVNDYDKSRHMPSWRNLLFYDLATIDHIWLMDRRVGWMLPQRGDGVSNASFWLILDSSAGLWVGILSAGDLVSQTSQLRILHSTGENCLLSIRKSLACARASKLTTTYSKVYAVIPLWLSLYRYKALH